MRPETRDERRQINEELGMEEQDLQLDAEEMRQLFEDDDWETDW